MKKTYGMLFSVVALSLAMIVSGCVSAPIKIAAVTDQQVDYSKGRTIEAGACGFQLFLLIPIVTNNRQERAYQELYYRAGENSVVTDVKVRERWTYAFIGTVYCTDLMATAYPKVAAASPPAAAPAPAQPAPEGKAP